MNDLVKNKGGRCLSNLYKNCKSKLEWQCKKLHTWFSTPENIINGRWCPHCARNAPKTIALMRKLANNNDGKCLSNSYKNVHTKLSWQCADGHVWKAQPTNIISGKWCPYCRVLIGEEKCRFVLEQLTGLKFPKTRGVLINHKLELDGFCDKLKLAFEHQGIQHYEIIQSWGSSNKLIRTQNNDIEKTRQCLSLGIRKINIPYWITKDNMILMNYIIEQLTILDIVLQGYVDWKSFQPYPSKSKKIRMQLQNRDITWLNSSFTGSREKGRFQCNKCKYLWDTRMDHVIRGSGCPQCAGKIQNINKMRVIAHRNGGDCLSKQYTNTETKLEWTCQEGHSWWAKPANIKVGKWCPFCAKVKRWETRKYNAKYNN